MYDDRRVEDTRRIGSVGLWLVATDSFLSGWGHAEGGRSFVAYPADNLTSSQKRDLEIWMENRPDFKRVRTNMHLPRLREGDHCSVYDVPNRFL